MRTDKTAIIAQNKKDREINEKMDTILKMLKSIESKLSTPAKKSKE